MNPPTCPVQRIVFYMGYCFTFMDIMSHNRKSTPEWLEWEADAIRYISQKHGPYLPLIKAPCDVAIKIGRGHRVDVDNVIKPLFDAVTKARFWIDDRLVKRLTIERVGIGCALHMRINHIKPDESESLAG